MPSIALAPQPCPDPPSVDRDPWCMSVKMALDQAVYQAWMHKYDIPSFAFARSWKRRYFILVDRTVYVFKSSKSTTPVREFFELTDDTLVFVSEEFKKAYVLELRKPLQRWYLRCDSVEQMKNWLEAMKKIVACIKLGFQGSISSSMLSSIRLTDDFRLVEDIPPRPSIDTTYSYRHSTTLPINLNSNSQNVRNRRWQQREMNDRRCSTPPDFALNNSNHKIPKSGFKRQSLLHIPNWATVLPPQLPPPRSLPPPIPSPTTATATATTTTTTALPTISETRQDHGS
ncbi:uncharacterized protein BYT42DRAFT_559987 [Radiomyces spectabilis]|uniref:uncharacterized protein n=1 Tax=Radiomyces spectabilis TaxID=64574 RepID=UPI00221FC423|nr:uncharacterized protein BYT42DRAFT_559987 [Radiomyces spectabilis]KAI8388417.1 hypothetical protein BYT42DRAFT_559987 [Radiomyces spectabilis]